MDAVNIWRIVLWGTPVVAAALIGVSNYKINQIEAIKKAVLEKEGLEISDTNKRFPQLNNSQEVSIQGKGNINYNISSSNQSGGFTGVVNNDIDAIQEIEALRLLEEIQKSPSRCSAIYDRLELLSVPSKHFSKFKILIEFSKKLHNDNLDYMGSSPYSEFRNRTMPALLKLFPKEVYEDTVLDEQFKLNSTTYYFSSLEREHLIKILNDVIKVGNFKQHRNAIMSMLIDICGYSPELLKNFENIFGKEKIKEMKPLWTEEELKLVDEGYKQLLYKLGII